MGGLARQPAVIFQPQPSRLRWDPLRTLFPLKKQNKKPSADKFFRCVLMTLGWMLLPLFTFCTLPYYFCNVSSGICDKVVVRGTSSLCRRWSLQSVLRCGLRFLFHLWLITWSASPLSWSHLGSVCGWPSSVTSSSSKLSSSASASPANLLQSSVTTVCVCQGKSACRLSVCQWVWEYWARGNSCTMSFMILKISFFGFGHCQKGK